MEILHSKKSLANDSNKTINFTPITFTRILLYYKKRTNLHILPRKKKYAEYVSRMTKMNMEPSDYLKNLVDAKEV